MRHEPEAVAEAVAGRPVRGPGDGQGAALMGDVADQDVSVARPSAQPKSCVAPAMTANLSSSSHWKRT